MRGTLKAAAAALALLLLGAADSRAATAPPERPRSTVDTTEGRQAGRTIRVPAGGNLQGALDAARGGDVILLAPGAVYEGPFRLPGKDGQQWIVIASQEAGTGLPPGRRVDPSRAHLMPRIVSATGPVFQTDAGAHHYRFVGLEVAPVSGVFLHALMQLGSDETDAAETPHHFIIDRCYFHGDRKAGSRRGIAMNSRDTAVIDSYFSDFKEVGADSQAIAGWNGPGPFKIAGNYLEASGENIMFGGADPTIRNLVPADIEVRHNHLAKPLAWKMGEERYEGVPWTVKNLFELKNARRVLVDGNVLEYNWPQAQNGFAILFTVRNQKGGAPWSTVEDVLFTNNLVRHVGSAINVLGHDDIQHSQQTRRIAVQNNLFVDVGGQWGNGRLLQLLDGTSDFTVDHNTALQSDAILFGGDHEPHTGLVFQNNIALQNRHGIIGSGTGDGIPSLERYFPGSVVRGNVIVGGTAAQDPRDNFFPASLVEIGLVDGPGGTTRFTLARRYVHAGTDGRDPGADLDAIARALAGVVASGEPVTLFEKPRRAEGGTPLPANAPPSGGSAAVPEVLFWAAALLLAYIYVGYPIISRLRAAWRPRAHRRAPIEPTVSIVVVAHNEGTRIAARIENLLALDYPRDRVEILIGSDGSTDATVEEARRYSDRGVKVHAFRERRGKPAVLNTLVPLASGEIVVFADARQRFDAGAVRALVSHFADPSTGAVSGELILAADKARPAGQVPQGAAFYWRYEKFIRATESRAGSTVGATGAIYAIRRALFATIPEDTVLDDVLIPVRIVRQGYGVRFERDARVYDVAPATADGEFARKTRTIAGTFQLFSREPWLLDPRANPVWFETVSHKALRLTLPALHATVFLTSLALVNVWIYPWALGAQLVFFAAALTGASRHDAGRRPVFQTVPYMMCLMIWATVVGCFRFLAHRQPVTWARTSPPAPLTRTRS